MAFFESTEQFSACARALFDRVEQEYPHAADAVLEAKLLIRFRCTNPTAEFLINGRRKPATVIFGTNRVRPEVDVQIETDTLHLIMLGELSVSKALAKKSMKVRGSVWKVVTLSDLFRQTQLLYPQILREQGLYP